MVTPCLCKANPQRHVAQRPPFGTRMCPRHSDRSTRSCRFDEVDVVPLQSDHLAAAQSGFAAQQDDHMTKSSETLQVNEAEQRDYDAEIDRVCVRARRTDRCVTSY